MLLLQPVLQPAGAADQPAQKLKAVEKALEESRRSQAKYAEEAEALAAEIESLRSSSIAAAMAAQQDEAAISEIEEQLAGLDRDEAAKTADLRRRSAQSVEILMALQRLARDPPEALALAPGEPVDTVRGGLLLGAAIPQIEAKARNLRAELAALAELRRQIAEKRRQLVAQSAGLADQELALRALTARKALVQSRAARGAEIGAHRLTQLSAAAGDLRDLIERLEAEKQQRAEEQQHVTEELLARATTRAPRPPSAAPKAIPSPQAEPAAPEPGQGDLARQAADFPKPKDLRPFSAAHGAMLPPVAGKLKLRYGENDEFGTASKGLVFLARPGGRVVAPFDGRIEFAGPFRGYGQILIIEHEDGYHSLLAGLERIDGAVGQWLVAGEPVGIMPADGQGAALYLELRRHGQPINPLPWLATRDDKVSG
jgi:septal ring factor EnvC (AmiA/AmiB activator)